MRRLHRMATIILLCLTLILPLSTTPAGATTVQGAVTHTDTQDYCMRASDVTMTMDEYVGYGSAEERQKAILKDASLEVYVRSSWDPYTGSYSADFSQLKDESSETGYLVTVTFPAISEGVSSEVTFRVSLTGSVTPDPEPEPEPEPDPPTPPATNTAPTPTYMVTINYLDEATGQTVKSAYQSNALTNGRAYDVTQEANTAMSNYTLKKIDGKVKGYINADVTINVYYEKVQKAPVAVITPPEPTIPEPQIPVVEETPTPEVQAPVVQQPVVQQPPKVEAKPVAPVTPKEEPVVEEKQPEPEVEAPVEEIPEPEVEEPVEEEPIKAVLPAPVKEIPVKSSTTVTPAEAAVVTVGAASVAVLGVGIVSDLKVLSWYEKMKHRKLGVRR